MGTNLPGGPLQPGFMTAEHGFGYLRLLRANRSIPACCPRAFRLSMTTEGNSFRSAV